MICPLFQEPADFSCIDLKTSWLKAWLKSNSLTGCLLTQWFVLDAPALVQSDDTLVLALLLSEEPFGSFYLNDLLI